MTDQKLIAALRAKREFERYCREIVEREEKLKKLLECRAIELQKMVDLLEHRGRLPKFHEGYPEEIFDHLVKTAGEAKLKRLEGKL